jgi:hypothetical protein
VLQAVAGQIKDNRHETSKRLLDFALQDDLRRDSKNGVGMNSEHKNFLGSLSSYIVRASGLVVPGAFALNAKPIIEFDGFDPSWVIAAFGATLAWFVIWRIAYFITCRVKARYWSDSGDLEKAAKSLIKTANDYAESQNRATRSFVLALTGVAFATALYAAGEFEEAAAVGVLATLLLIVSYSLQFAIPVRRLLHRPIYFLLKAAHSDKSLGEVINEHDSEEEFEKFIRSGFATTPLEAVLVAFDRRER